MFDHYGKNYHEDLKEPIPFPMIELMNPKTAMKQTPKGRVHVATPFGRSIRVGLSFVDCNLGFVWNLVLGIWNFPARGRPGHLRARINRSAPGKEKKQDRIASCQGGGSWLAPLENTHLTIAPIAQNSSRFDHQLTPRIPGGCFSPNQPLNEPATEFLLSANRH